MSQENVRVATRLVEQAAQGGFDAVWELLDPDLAWETSPNLPDAGVYRGRERVRAFIEEQWDVVWGGMPRVDIERAFDCGDNVLLFTRVRGHGSHTGIPLDVQIAQLVTIQGGKVVRVKVFPDRDEALQAAGLKE
jgi:ketosteroid isomerase-like protein